MVTHRAINMAMDSAGLKVAKADPPKGDPGGEAIETDTEVPTMV
jgi:hypothetical protein